GGRGSVSGAPQRAPSRGRARAGTGSAAARAGRPHLGRPPARAGAGAVMRIAVVSPHLPTRALPMRGVSHDEQLRLFVEAGHEVRAVVPLPWSPRRWLAGAPIPDEERDGAVLVAHPRYPWMPRFVRGATLERRLFGRAAATALALGRAAPDLLLPRSASLPGALLGQCRLALR